MSEKRFSREERAEISAKFRDELKAHGIMNAVLTVLDSKSEKNEVKKTVLSQQCRKKEFKTKFLAACEAIKATYPSKRMAVKNLSAEII